MILQAYESDYPLYEPLSWFMITCGWHLESSFLPTILLLTTTDLYIINFLVLYLPKVKQNTQDFNIMGILSVTLGH